MNKLGLICDKSKKGTLKLNKAGLSITAVLLVSTTLLSGCGKTVRNNNYNNGYSYNYNYNSDAEDSYNLYEIELTEEEIANLNVLLDNDVKITDVNLAGFKNYLSSISDTYHYDELYGIEEALNKYDETTTSNVLHHSGDFIGSDNQFSYNEIYQQICKNNSKYQKENSAENGKVNFYKELDNESLEKACKIITDVLNSYLKNDSVTDIKELSCILSNLKVLKDNTSFCNAYVTDDDCLLISPNMLNVMDLMNSENTFEQTVTHEVEHLLQKSCQDDQEKNSKTIGICNRYDELDINPLFFDWFYEASAEKETCNFMGTEPIVYKNMISYLESLSLSTILYDNTEVNQTEKLCTQRDLNKLFEQFHCESEEDKKEIIKMMFAIDIIQNDDEEFIEQYENKYGISLTNNDLLNIKYELKTDICRSYLKVFYKSLSETLKEKQVSLKDVFYLIRLTESDINNHILYDDSTKYEYNKEFMEQAINMQQVFFESLDSDYTIDELITMYNDYQIAFKNSENVIEYNCSLSWLDEGKKDYLKTRTDFLLEYSNISISKSYQNQNEYIKTK